MVAAQLAEAIGAVHPNELDRMAKLVWQGYAAGTLSDPEAGSLAMAIQIRREARPEARDFRRWKRPALVFSRAAAQRSPDKQRSLERRRTLAASGPMPPGLACTFTTGELAVLRIVGDEFKAKGVCDRTVAELAARAGVGASTVRNAVRCAGREGLLTVQARPRPGRKNLSNLVRVISREWLLWLSRGPRRRPDGTPPRDPSPPFKKSYATDSKHIDLRKTDPGDRPDPGPYGRRSR